ncbi:MAG: tRNA (adenine(22)-N(1))-methyltransferase [Candidatus Izemoplasmataceae bacterium]
MLKNRLSTCMTYLKGHHVLYDIGTDHAYLPIAAVKANLINKAYAVDNKIGPLKRAAYNIKLNDLDHVITPVLSSGIEALTEDVDVILMAGLGGNLMYNVFHNQSIKNVKRLVLQPNNHHESVRKLTLEGYKIIDETVVTEESIHYIIIVLEKGTANYSEKEMLFGPYLLKKKEAAYKELLTNEQNYLKTLIDMIPHEQAKKRHIKRLKSIEEVLYEWRNN